MVTSMFTLDQIPPDLIVRVVNIRSSGVERRRLFDLGITPGTLISVEMRSPLGDPTAYLVRDTVIALRREQAQHIDVEPVEEGASL